MHIADRQYARFHTQCFSDATVSSQHLCKIPPCCSQLCSSWHGIVKNILPIVRNYQLIGALSLGIF